MNTRLVQEPALDAPSSAVTSGHETVAHARQRSEGSRNRRQHAWEEVTGPLALGMGTSISSPPDFQRWQLNFAAAICARLCPNSIISASNSASSVVTFRHRYCQRFPVRPIWKYVVWSIRRMERRLYSCGVGQSAENRSKRRCWQISGCPD